MAAQPFRAGAPLRGLAAFTEADRDVFFGRDRDRDEVVKMVTADGFRAGLLYGESGVGKTSLLQAGLIPALRDHGAVVVPCNNLGNPAQAFADGLLAASRGGIQPHQGEAPLAFASRVVANAPHHQLHIFVFDDVDLALAEHGEKVVADIAELFTRVLSRGSGRARVLFVSASEHVHALGALERRTGSLFPPSSRHELMRMAPADAAATLDRTLQFGGVTSDQDLVDSVIAGLGRGGPVLPADIQIAALALRDLRISTATQLARAGGVAELEAGWVTAAAQATGHERTGLRILGELAMIGRSADASRNGGPKTSSEVAARLGVSPAEVARTLAVLEDRGLVVRTPGTSLDAAGGVDDQWALRNTLLGPRVRELTAPARAAARRAYDLLGSKAASKQRLTLRELQALRGEQIAPVTDAERDVVQRSKRFYMTIAGAIAAVPVVILILLWSMNRGRFYYDVEPGPGGDRIKVRAGRAGLSGFHWLPSSPGFGSVVADTGLSRSMVDDKAWRAIRDQDLGGDLDGWASGLDRLLRADLAGLIRYATTGDEAAIKALADAAKTDDDRAELLTALVPIARGTPAELALVEQALGTPSPALQKAAVAVAGAAAGRGADAYRDVLIGALASPDPELRRIALTAVRGLGTPRSADLFTAALARDPDPGARRELMLEVATAAPEDAPSADGPVAVLADDQATDVQREQAREGLARALAADKDATIAAVARLLADEQAPVKSRTFAVQFLRDAIADKRDDLTTVGDAARTAFGAREDELRAAALPLYARADPTRAVDDLTSLSERKPKPSMRIAIATAWGELARSKPEQATVALDKLLEDNDSDVRAAAAAAYGYLGRVAQEALVKMVKNERFDVAIGAAHGLAASAEVGASVGVATGGIYQLWKQKGKPRREAAKVYARLARRKPKDVVDYLGQASTMADDPGLHPIGVEGLCNAVNAGSTEARTRLARATSNPSTDVRRMVIRCVANGKDPGKNGVKIANDLIDDQDASIRAEAARVLALAARNGKVSNEVAGALIRRLRDPSREVRLIAMRALPALGADALQTERDRKDKKGAEKDPIGAAFETGDEAEKLALLRAARELGMGDLVQMSIGDASPLVRVEAVDLAIATDTRVAATIASALADADPQVRRAALGRIASGAKIDAAAVDRALALGIRDPDPSLAQLALTTLAKVAEKDDVIARLGRALASRAESDRAKAAAAAIGLVERDAAAAKKLLEPLLADPSHDVRVAMLPALGKAWATTNSPEELAKLLRGSERDAMKRLVATAAFLILAETDGGRSAAEASLGTIAKNGPPMARRSAQLALGLIGSRADGISFLQYLVP